MTRIVTVLGCVPLLHVVFFYALTWAGPPAPVYAAMRSGSFLSESAPESKSWIGPDGKKLPFNSDDEVKEFLRSAKVVHMETTKVGVNHPRRVDLEKDGIRARGIFRDVEIYKRRWEGSQALRFNFRDSCIYECAAYELSRLLGMDNIPPTVRRRINDQTGTLQLWLENVMMERERRNQGIEPPNKWRWMMQQQLMRIFDQLIYNDDRNQGNMLIDRDWKLWLIDHTRSFRTFTELPEPKRIKYCERGLWEKLKNLDERAVQEKLSPFLDAHEIKTLLRRHQKLVAHMQGLINQNGESSVLFSFPVQMSPPTTP